MARLTAEQRAELEKQLREDDEAVDDFEIEIGSGDSYARLPYSRGRKFLQEKFGVDLPEKPEQDDADESKAKGGKQQQGGQVRAFQRRIG